MEIIYLLASFILGGVTGFFIFRGLSKSGDKIYQEKINALNESLAETKQLLKQKESEFIQLTRDTSYQQAENKALKEKLDMHKEELVKLHERFNIEFKNMANEILEEKTKKFTEQNKVNLDHLLKPLSEKIKDFEKKVEDTYDKESKQRFSLKEEVKKLAELNQKVSDEAGNLTKALKGETKTQGNWGEMILEKILEKSGLVKDREYYVQATYRDDDGLMLRPDVIIEYPGERYVIVDSKVSLTAYERYASSDDEPETEKALQEHVQSVRNHIINLSRKNYQEIYELKSLDFVMLFMPIEPAYLSAIQKDPELWNYAYERRVLLISPTNLIAALKMISSLWQQEYQNRNAREIAKKSSDLLDKFYSLLADLEDLGTKLDSTRRVYDETVKKLSAGRGNLIKRTKDIQKLGAKSAKPIPQRFRDHDEEV